MTNLAAPTKSKMIAKCYTLIYVSRCSVIKLHNRTHVVYDQTKSTKPVADTKETNEKKKQQQRRSGRRCTETRVEHNSKIYVLAHSSIIIYTPQRHRASHQTFFFFSIFVTWESNESVAIWMRTEFCTCHLLYQSTRSIWRCVSASVLSKRTSTQSP